MSLLSTLRGWLRRPHAHRPGTARGRCRPALECLETRLTPANVSGTVQSGVLTLAADGASAAESLTITPKSGSPAHDFTVTGTAGTTIDGDASHVFAGVRAIVLRLRGGDDSATLTGVRLPGGVTFKGGDGTNSFRLDGDSRVGGSVRVVNGQNATGFDSVSVVASRVVGSVVVSNEGGNSNSSVADASVGGGLRVTGRGGVDIVGVGADAVIGGGVTANLGGGTNFTSVVDASIARTLRVTGRAGSDTLQLTDTEVGGGLRVLFGNGGGSLSIDGTDSGFVSDQGSTVRGALTYVGGNGLDGISGGFEKPVTLGGPVSITTGAGVSNDIVGFDDTLFLGSVFIDTGDGPDLVALEQQDTAADQTTRLRGKLTVRTGAGNDALRLGVAGQADRKVRFAVKPVARGGAGTDSLFRENYVIAGKAQRRFAATGFEFITPPF